MEFTQRQLQPYNEDISLLYGIDPAINRAGQLVRFETSRNAK